jgi:hypothetical protein
MIMDDNKMIRTQMIITLVLCLLVDVESQEDLIKLTMAQTRIGTVIADFDTADHTVFCQKLPAPDLPFNFRCKGSIVGSGSSLIHSGIGGFRVVCNVFYKKEEQLTWPADPQIPVIGFKYSFNCVPDDDDFGENGCDKNLLDIKDEFNFEAKPPGTLETKSLKCARTGR